MTTTRARPEKEVLVNHSPDPDALPDSVLVVRALPPEEEDGRYLFRLSWGADGEPETHAAVDRTEVHRLVDAWLEGLVPAAE